MKQLLFMDDEVNFERIIRKRFKNEIKEQTYLIEFARSGEEALELIKKSKPDLLLTDLKVNAEDMDGFNLIKTLKELDIKIQTIVISAYTNMGNYCEAIKEDVLFFLPKPFDLVGLKDLIDLAINKELSIESTTETPEMLRDNNSDVSNNVEEKENFIDPNAIVYKKTIKKLPFTERLNLIYSILDTLRVEELKELKVSFEDRITECIKNAALLEAQVEVLRQKQKEGLISADIPLDNSSALRIGPKLARTNGTEYGPYWYVTWTHNGKTISRGLGRDPFGYLINS